MATTSQSTCTERRGIVVGVDRPAASDRAVEWAAEEAALRSVGLELVSVWEDPYRYWREGVPLTPGSDIERAALRAASEGVAAAAQQVRARHPQVEVSARALEGSAADVLVERSAGAELLVVGTRGRGGFAGLLLGSVSQQCVTHARCPVVVVRPADDEGQG